MGLNKNYTPKTLREALEIRANEEVIPYAGGTDLMVRAQHEKPYLFLNQIDELKGVKETEEGIEIGAGTTFTELVENGLTPEVLRAACSEIAAPAIRNAGTIGGNIANASPKADSALVLYALDADVVLESRNGERRVPVREFITDRGRTSIKPDEILTKIILPEENLRGSYYYHKVGARNALAISRVSFVGLMDADGERIKNCSTAFGAIDRTVFTAPELDSLLIGKTIDEAKDVKEEYLEGFRKAINPISGRVSAEYRKDVCLNLLEDFLESNGI